VRKLLLAAALVPWLAFWVQASEAKPGDFPAARANDNRVPAGELRNGVLTVHLDLVEVTWYPEKEPGPSLHVYAFAEQGRQPQIPGPLIRVPQGTEVRASIHNALPVAMFLRGLHARDAAKSEPLRIGPGETADVRFTATTPGSYYYSARSMKQSIEEVGLTTITDDLPMGEPPFGIESQLDGGFVVDPPGGSTDDRIFVITLWMRGVITPPFREVAAINGKTWPYTERLSQRVGDTVRWRILNPSMSDHAMHLHGFFFLVNSLGDGEHDRIYTQEEAPHAVTQYLVPGGTTSLTWTPERAGQWLLHCHMTGHMSPDLSLVTHPLEPTPEHASHAEPGDSAGMGGLILGIKVSPAGDRQPAASSTAKARQLRLVVREKPATRFSPLRMGYLIQEGEAKETSDPPPLPGAPLVLTRGEPVEILVVNELHEVTSVHWHGIELESYYDGVPGWSGGSPQVTPPIPPGGTFLARMTPPRAGTFIYHTHWHDVGQLTSGLYGPLIVVEPGQKFDPEVDKVFIISRAGPDESEFPLVLNGSPQPPPLVLKAGMRYRLRFINISTNDSDLKVSLLADSKPVQWRAVAKDGWTLPDAQATPRPAQQGVTVGETRDFEFVAGQPGKLVLEVTMPFLEMKLSQLINVR
jgi:FtsP/CotA-like multicopper oxidase with cupredoxin domain